MVVLRVSTNHILLMLVGGFVVLIAEVFMAAAAEAIGKDQRKAVFFHGYHIVVSMVYCHREALVFFHGYHIVVSMVYCHREAMVFFMVTTLWLAWFTIKDLLILHSEIFCKFQRELGLVGNNSVVSALHQVIMTF